MSETKHVAMNAKQQEQLDQILRGICKERKVAVEADLDSRLSYREKDPDKPKQASWDAYSRRVAQPLTLNFRVAAPSRSFEGAEGLIHCNSEV